MQLSGRGHGALEMGSAVIQEQNWKSEQVKPRPSPGWLYSVSLVTRIGADRRAGAGPILEAGRRWHKRSTLLGLARTAPEAAPRSPLTQPQQHRPGPGALQAKGLR